jgi:hypothetical protein
VGIVWNICYIFGVYNMWQVCGKDGTCFEVIICGDSVERM